MEQQQEKTKTQINIQLGSNGELNLSGLALDNLTQDEFILVQRLIDESQARSINASRVKELMQQGMLAQTAIAAFAVLMLSFMGFYGITRFIGYQVQQVQENYTNVR
ncbi:hypothetical protein LC593_31445 [Nostoc sp. CHAB 5844]|nr:hypothetical protein [Nostoc sp. CHAB 5844]